MLRSASVVRFWIASACLLALGGARPALAQDSAGWQLLWGNHIGAAAQSFRNDVAKTPNDADALRGLGWTSYYKDDDVSALRYWSRAVVLDPAAWTSAALWPLMLTTAEDIRRYNDIDAAAKSILAAHGVAPELRSSATLLLAHQADRVVSLKRGDEIRGSLGMITDWRVVGPFDNASKSGLDKVFPPEQSIDFTAPLTGKDDLVLKWRHCPLVTRDDYCAVGTFLEDRDPDVFYAATAVNVASGTNAVLRMNAGGACKAYVNGHLVFSTAVYHDLSSDIVDALNAPIRLTPGWNTILVKLADADTLETGLQLRITDQDGAPIRFRGIDSAKANGALIVTNPDAANASGAAAGASAYWLAPIIGQQVHTVEGALLLALYLNSVSDYDAAEDLLHAAIAEHPQCSELHWELSVTLDSDQQADDARVERDAARSFTPEIAQAELAHYDDVTSALTAADRVKQLRALALRYPASLDIAFELGPLLISSGSSDDAFRMLRKIVVANGGAGALLRLASFYDDQGDRPEVDRMISQEVKTDPTDVGALNEYGSTLDAKNDIPHAVEADLKVLKLQPDDLATLRALASDYTTAQNTQKAVAAYEQLAVERPQDASVQSSLGDALQRAGRRSEALACYQLAVRLDPNSASARDTIQVLTGQKPIIDLAPALPTPNLDSLRGKPSGSAPSTVFFVDEKREVVYPDYLTVCEYHEVMKVNDQAAVERYQSYHLDRDSQASTIHVLSARLIKADGKVEDHSDDSSDDDEVDFPSLDTGDIIDIDYRVEDRAKGVLAHQFWSSWYFSGPENEDRHSRFSLITPVGMTYKYVVHGGAPEPTERISGQWRIRQWDVVNGPAHKEETYGVPVNDWAEWVDVSTIESWRDVVSWYQDLSDPRCQPDETIRAKAAELTRGASTLDDKIAALVRYVSHDIQYQSTPFRLSAYVPTEGKEVVRERYGDCKDKAALLTAMLSTIGIKSRMVLLSPRTYGLTPYLPSPRFAHAIALVDAPGGPLWIDGTADDLGYRHLPIADQGVSALVIDSSTQDLQPIPFLPVENRASTTDMHGTIDAGGRFVCDVTVTMTGNYAWSVRSLLRKIPADKDDEVLRGFASALVGMDYDGGSITCKDDPDAPVIFEVKCHDDQFGTPAGSFMLIDSPWGVKHDSSLLNTLSAPDRTQDLDLAESRESMAVNIAIDLPAGYVPQDLAPTVAAQSPWGSYSFQYSVDGNQLKESYTGVASAQRVPLADIPKYVAYSRAMEDEFSKKIVLKKS